MGSVNAKPVVKNVINFIMLVTFFNFKFNERNDLFFEERKVRNSAKYMPKVGI